MGISNIYVARISSKGQATIPIEVRRLLGLSEPDKVLFRVIDGKVEIEPVRLTVESAFGSVQPKTNPDDLESIRAAVREERVNQILTELNDE